MCDETGGLDLAVRVVFGRLLGMRELVMAGGAVGLVLGLGAVAVWARAGTVTVRRLADGEQESVRTEDVVAWISGRA
jgi:hypothetical protein